MLDLKLALDIKLFFVDYLHKEKHMTTAYLEHANITVENPDELASLLCTLFGWKVRWSGGAKNDGYTVHVGNDYKTLANINHICTLQRRITSHFCLHVQKQQGD